MFSHFEKDSFFAIRLTCLFGGVFIVAYIPISTASVLTLEDIVTGVNFARQTIENGEVHIEIVESPRILSEETLQTILDKLKTRITHYKTLLQSPELTPRYKTLVRNWLMHHREVMATLPSGVPTHEEQFVSFEIINPLDQNSIPQKPYQYRYRIYKIDRTIDEVSESITLFFHLGSCRTYVFDGISQLYHHGGPYLNPELNIYDFENEKPFLNLNLQLLGRCLFRLPAPAELGGNDKSIRLMFENKQGQQEVGYIIEYRQKKLIYRLWVDPDKSFCLDRLVVFHELQPGSLLEEHTYSDYTRSPNGVWYPQTIQIKKQKSKFSREIFVRDARFNITLPQNIFRIEKDMIPERTKESEHF